MRLEIRAMGRRTLFMALLGVLFLATPEIVRANIFEELHRTCPDPMRLSGVLWMPIEFFEASLEQLPEAAMEEFREMLDGYSLFAAVDGRMSPLGIPRFLDESDMRKGLAIVKDGKRYDPVPAEDTPDELRHLQSMMQRAWASMMGAMGENMRLFLFQVELDAASPGEFFVRLGGADMKEESFRYETPLRAVVPDTPCEKCEYPVRASWNYCPRCGNQK